MTAALIHAGRRLAGRPTPGARRIAGFLILAAGLVALTAEAISALLRWIAANPALVPALVATAVTAATTALGAVPVLLVRRVSSRAQDTMLGFGAGVMLAASAFSLILPGIEAGTELAGSRGAGVGLVAGGILLGALAMLLLDRFLPHEHFLKGAERARATELKRIWLFVAAVALHNFPEGLAVGVGFGGGNVANGVALALGIAAQNIPEGLVVALALASVGYPAPFAAAAAAATGVLEPLGGALGAGMLGASEAILPWGLGFAAGAMIFVVSHEVIPESHRMGHERESSIGLICGFVLMMILDTVLD
ncbi:MAG TPA: ZIP family metal transporter [Burkholderiales bacterium]|jgi:ZIP family zinc transporter|nr:ZIP family metal transporter [Burkholderiales bacterium]